MYQQVEREKARIWNDLSNRTKQNEADFQKQFTVARHVASVLFALVIAAFTFAPKYPLLWFAVVVVGSYLVSILAGVQISGQKFSIFDLKAKQKLRDHAHNAAKARCSQDASKVQGHTSSLAMISQLLLRPSTFDDSEEQVARRLAAAKLLGTAAKLSILAEN